MYKALRVSPERKIEYVVAEVPQHPHCTQPILNPFPNAILFTLSLQMKYATKEANAKPYTVAWEHMMRSCNENLTIVVGLWRSVWTELLHATAKAHRHVDYSRSRSDVFAAMDPAQRSALDQYILVYHGGSQAGIARLVLPRRCTCVLWSW